VSLNHNMISRNTLIKNSELIIEWTYFHTNDSIKYREFEISDRINLNLSAQKSKCEAIRKCW
jgi:hypothetical protein